MSNNKNSLRQLLQLLGVVVLIILLWSIFNPFKNEVGIELNEPQVDTFIQGEASDKIDVLWVIDNSFSMEPSQENLAANFSAFAQKLVNKTSNQPIDFQMAVITTDMADNGRFANNQILKKSDAVENREKFINDFKKMVKVGIQGSAMETPLICTVLATRNDNNNHFFRNDAILIINLLSDESDMSANFIDNLKDMSHLITGVNQNIGTKTNNIEDLNGKSLEYKIEALGIRLPPEDISNEDVLYFVKELKKFKPGKRVMINSIGIMRNDSSFVRNDSIFQVSADPQVLASKMTNGMLADISGDFSTTLSNWGDNLSSLASSFALSRKPDDVERMEVEVDGYFVDPDEWFYNEKLQTIEFVDGYLPETGAEIRVHYEYFDEYEGYDGID